MGPLSTAILAGCLQALKWLSWIICLLLGVLVVVQSLRGDEGAQPLANVMVALAFAAGGALCGYVARVIIRRGSD
ncbi:MAG: hypothetical protein Q7T73_00030 [Beijerinckiaceae bacterium]|nr:hypothetical protein [Beijerinckiaceae bacterium]